MSDCYIVGVMFTEKGQVQFNFFRQEKAMEAYTVLRAADRGEGDFEFEIEDDYGTKAMINRDEVCAVIYQDLKRAQEGTAEVQMLMARSNAALQTRAKSDPVLRFAQPTGQMNGVLG